MRNPVRPLPLAVLLAAAGQGGCTGISVQPFGILASGQAVQRVTLENDRGMRLSYIDYGATLVSAEVADRRGRRRNVILSLPDLESYVRTKRRFASVIGRYAGRIGGARFTLDGRTVQLPANARGVAIHGEPDGYEKRVWQRQDFADAASIGSIYRLVSGDGDQGFPGRLELTVTYRLMRGSDEFRIEYAASTDAPTVLNPTNHAYFNLAGAGSAGMSSHRFRIAADRYAVTDEKKVPTGELAGVAGTPLDFRRPAGIARWLEAGQGAPASAAAAALLGSPPGYDHALMFPKRPGEYALVAVVDELASGRRMEVRTTAPSVLFNSGNGFDGSEPGAEGRAYARYDGFALETQGLPDAPNKPQFPSTVLRPGEAFRSMTSFRFGLRGR
jgi:aldose 1-epimerase